MAFRVVFIENDTFIKLKLENMILNKNGEEIWIPLDDISMVVLDNMKITLTARVLCSIAEHNIGLIICNQEHLPIGFYSSYDNHSRISKNIGYQIEKTQEYYDFYWKEIIEHKIANQCEVLELLGKKEEVQNMMKKFIKELTEGDKTNREAHAAKVYFNELMGCSYSRGNEDILLNSGLDYGYAVIRAYIARLCVGYGLNSQLGIHHKNEYNRFNLIDDLIEPVRPFVDLLAYRLLAKEEYFTQEHRIKLVNLLNHKIIYKNKKMFMCNMLEEYIMQFAMLLAGKCESICYPSVKDYLGEEDAAI